MPGIVDNIVKYIIQVTGTGEITLAAKETENLGNQADIAANKTQKLTKEQQAANKEARRTAQDVRNVSFQIQDMAVQIAGGTSAFVAMGQQIPQLLGSFGAMGAVIGAVAAVSIPLIRAGISAFTDFDLRNLQERTNDLTASTKAFKEAQQQNLSTISGLSFSYGSLSDEAKRFYTVNEDLKGQKVFSDFQQSVRELKKDYGIMNTVIAQTDQIIQSTNADEVAALSMSNNFYLLKIKLLGLTAEQATEVAKRIKGIDENNPQQTAETINGILEYLKQFGPQTEGFRRRIEEVVPALTKINESILEQKRNIQAAADEASKFGIDMMQLQMRFVPQIGDARRGFDQITAIRKEGELKVAEFAAQAEQKRLKDGYDRTLEVNQFRLKTEQEVQEKIKDVAKAQYEIYNAAHLTNQVKLRQIALESSIITLRDKGIFSLQENVRYDETLLKNANEYEERLKGIDEQLRKREITAERGTELKNEAKLIRTRQDAAARQQLDADIRRKMIMDEMEISKKSIEDQIAGNERLGSALQRVNDQREDVLFARTQIGRGAFERQIDQIRENARKAALEASRAFAAGFTDTGDGLTPERTQELADGLEKIRKRFAALTDEEIRNLNLSRDWSAGWNEAFANYADSAKNAADQAKTYFDTFTRGMEDAFINFAKTGKLSFSDLINNMLSEVIRFQTRALMTQGGGGSFLGWLGGLLGMGSKATSGGGIPVGMSPETLALIGLAGGGSANANQPYIVGENGPELFIPKSAGSIMPNSMTSQALGNTAITYNINAVDASSFRQLVAQDPQFIYNITEVGRRSVPSRRLA